MRWSVMQPYCLNYETAGASPTNPGHIDKKDNRHGNTGHRGSSDIYTNSSSPTSINSFCENSITFDGNADSTKRTTTWPSIVFTTAVSDFNCVWANLPFLGGKQPSHYAMFGHSTSTMHYAYQPTWSQLPIYCEKTAMEFIIFSPWTVTVEL